MTVSIPRGTSPFDSRSPEERARLRERDAQIRILSRKRTVAQLADQFGITSTRVRQILARPDPDVELAERRLILQAELAELNAHQERNRAEIAGVRRALARIAEQEASRDIDRLLDLA